MVLRALGRASLWAWALVFLAAVCTFASAGGGGVGGGGCSGPCPSLPYGSWKSKDEYACYGKCDNGADAKAICTAGSYNVTVSCPQVTGCKQSDLSYPYVSSWSCKDSNTCYAYCKDGYKGVVKAICSGGAWHYYGECKLSPPCPKYCWYHPPRVDGIFWPYTCYGADYVKAYCGPGYQPGYVEARCTCGRWFVTGQCKKIEVPRCDHRCWSMPPNVAGISWPNTCYGSTSYTAQCQSGYYSGTVKATCKCGTWEVTGSCTKIPQPTCNKYCYGLPPPVTGVYWPNNCWGASNFKATCMSGYTGTVEAKCECGKWVTYGNCQRIQTPPPCPATCAGKPAPVTGIYWPNSCKGTSYVKASCKPGYVSGYVEAKCQCGTWVTYGTCPKITVTRKCRGTPKRKYGARSWSYRKCNKKTSCSVKCSYGYRGKGYKARCVRGKWKVSGSCHRKRYFFF